MKTTLIGLPKAVSRGDGDSVFHTYLTNGRCAEALGSVWTFLDLAPFGRQEDWEGFTRGVAANGTVLVVAAPR